MRSWNVDKGAFFGDSEVRAAAKVCVLGSTVANALFEGQDPVGQTVRIKNFPFRVIGVLETKGGNTMGQDQDDVVIAPYTTVMHLLKDNTKIDMFMASAVSADRRAPRRRSRSRPCCASGTASRPDAGLGLHDPVAAGDRRRRPTRPPARCRCCSPRPPRSRCSSAASAS